jgi:hypothetical protein
MVMEQNAAPPREQSAKSSVLVARHRNLLLCVTMQDTGPSGHGVCPRGQVREPSGPAHDRS